MLFHLIHHCIHLHGAFKSTRPISVPIPVPVASVVVKSLSKGVISMGFVVVYVESVGAIVTAAMLGFGAVGVAGFARQVLREFRR